ncbi:MAG: type II secretion system protein [bacterium]|nr:type II secretion system protein [bacterium]
MMKYFWKKRGQRGFTLIELVVVLAILGILIALAVPRYMGARRNALVAEGDNVLQELKTLSWAYYQQYSTWTGVDAGTFTSAFGFEAPDQGCWTYEAVGDAALSIEIVATSDPVTVARCSPLPVGATITVTLYGGGNSTRALAW